MQQLLRSPVEHTPDGPEEGGQGLVVEDDDDAGLGQLGGVVGEGLALGAPHVIQASPQGHLEGEEEAGSLVSV